MPKDERVDAYIAKFGETFAVPILNELRQRLHSACPEITETIKWGMPAFEYRGKAMAHMAAFKAHASFGFWHGETVTGWADNASDGMGSFGKLTSVADLPGPGAFAAMVATAMDLIERGVKPPSAAKAKAPKPMPPMPPSFQAALDAAPDAAARFAGFAPGQRRDYVEWIEDAKQAATQQRRIAQAIEWISEGKHRNWKYER